MKLNRNIISLIIFNFILFLFIFIVIEVVFRIVGIPYKIVYIPYESSFSRFDHELGWSYLPNKSAQINTENKPKFVYYEANGIRVPSPDFKLDYTKPSILFIGGSFTMGQDLSYKESFVGKFEALQETPYQIVNLGVQGYGSDQTLIALKRYLPKFQTKIVIYTFIEDHILRNGNYDRRLLTPTARFLGTKPQFALNNNKELYLSHKPLLYTDYINSFVFDFLKIRTGTILDFPPPFPEELTKAIIKEMKEYSNNHDAHFVVLNWRWTQDDYDALFRDIDINVIDTMEDAPSDWAKMRLNIEHGGIHPNEQAGDHAAKLLHVYIKEILLKRKTFFSRS